MAPSILIVRPAQCPSERRSPPSGCVVLHSCSRQLPIPHLFMALSIAACLLMIASMLGPRAGSALDVTHMGAVSMEDGRAVAGQER
jgi:hypothetical protein